MIVLGLFGFGMNPSACLLRAGKLVAFCEEERFTRTKGAPDAFPGHATKACLNQAGITLDEVDSIAFAWDCTKYPFRMLTALAGQYARYRPRATSTAQANGGGAATVSSAVLNLLKYTPSRLKEQIRLGLRRAGVEGRVPEIEFVPHHLSHAYSSFFASGFDEALVLTLDGSGENVCTQIATARGRDLQVRRTIPIPHSLGWYYAAFTEYFGFRHYRHEGKFMGLAALGHERAASNPWPDRLESVLSVSDGTYEVDPVYTRFGRHSRAERYTDRLVDFLTGFDRKLGPVPCTKNRLQGSGEAAPYLSENYVDLAWGVQAQLEKAVLHIAESAAKEYGGLRKLCIAGGVGLNCKLNGALLRSPAFDEVFVQPAANDAGSALGAAMWVAAQGGDDIAERLEHTYYGPNFESAEIRELLKRCKLNAVECDDIASTVAQELAQGKLVGWFQGAAEYGPRSLGARSILADPNTPGVSETLNLQVKGREAWRPFCPSVLVEEAPGLYEGCDRSPFMTTAFRVKPERLKDIGGAVHVDGTVRPQTVSAKQNPRMHSLISEFRELTGSPQVINTSFNLAGEPIVSTPQEALRTFYASGLDVLALGDFLLTK
mgnify:CR=1 FL=1